MTPVKVLIDAVAFQNQQSGIQRYYLEMLRRLPHCDPALFISQPLAVALPEGFEVIRRNEHFFAPPGNLPLRMWRKLRRNWLPTRLPEADLFHSTYFTRSPRPGLPEVVTIHDMVIECWPYYYLGDVNAEIIRRRDCILNAAAIITISAATRDDLLSVYPEVAARVQVIHHGVDHLLSAPQPSATPAGPPYVLYVGDRAAYKNFATLVAALGEAGWPAGLQLKVVGREFTAAERMLFRHRGVADKIIQSGRVSDRELGALYRGAAALILPSLCEGFSFPVVEAQGNDVPVVASTIPVFHEIGGEGLAYFKPLDPVALAAAVGKTLDRAWREHAIELGRQNIRRFSWQQCAERTSEVFRAAAKKS